MTQAKLVWLSPSDLKPFDKNAKKHPRSQIDGLKAQILAHGFDVPIVLWKDRLIIKGHGRRQAALEAGLEKVPCLIREDLTEDQARAARIADNKLAESEWDEDLLKAELRALSEIKFDLDLTGFSNLELTSFMTDGETQSEKEKTYNGSQELDSKSFSEFECKCPRCGFEFNK